MKIKIICSCCNITTTTQLFVCLSHKELQRYHENFICPDCSCTPNPITNEERIDYEDYTTVQVGFMFGVIFNKPSHIQGVDICLN